MFCPKNGCGLPGHGGHAFFGSVNDDKIREVRFTGNRLGILSGWPKVVISRSDRILSMERNPVNHHLYFSDPNGIYELVPGEDPGIMRVYDSFLDAVGDTPLVRLSRVARGVRPTVLAKLEMLNPGGSVKDRIGIRMIEAAERYGRPQARWHDRRADVRQHRTRARHRRGHQGVPLHLRDAGQDERREGRAAARVRRGGRHHPTAVPPESPESYYRVADRLTEEIPGAYQPNQYFNQENPRAHYETTGPEIWETPRAGSTSWSSASGPAGPSPAPRGT